MAHFNFNSFGINTTTLNNLGFPGVDVRIWSVTLDPIVHLNPRGPVDFYLIGGGIYHRLQEFTTPTVGTVTGFDPFFGFFPVAVPATQVLAPYSVNKPGANGGQASHLAPGGTRSSTPRRVTTICSSTIVIPTSCR
jgi:hypothetical protein